MITVESFDDANIHRPNIEIHWSINSLKCIPQNNKNLRTSPTTLSESQFSESNSIATTLHSSLEYKIEELNSRKELLLKNRNKIFDSFSYRFFALGRNKINIIDTELDKIEEEIYCLKRSELQGEISSAMSLIEKTNRNLLKYRLETL